MAKKRRTELSILNVLFCLLVILIHIISYPVSAFLPGTAKYTAVMLPWRLASFVVQGFVFLSGVKLFLNGKEQKGYIPYLKGRLKGIIVPYILCYAVYYAYYMIRYGYPMDILFFGRHFLLGSLVCHMYFIPLLFQFDLLFPVWKRLVGKVSGVVFVPFAIVLTLILESYLPTMLSAFFPQVNFIYNDRLFTTYVSYWLIGCYVGKNYDAFSDILKKNFKALSVIYGFVTVLCVLFSYMAFNQFAYVPYMNLWHSVYCLTAIVFLFALAKKIPDSIWARVPLATDIDKASFYIYLWHMLVLLLTNDVLDRLGIVAQAPGFLIRCVAVYGITIFMCVLYTRIKKGKSVT
ncbi:MAG: acyltransferase [Clostridia bacterium]|nr:acyltransferase [Clostridia bacterium]